MRKQNHAKRKMFQISHSWISQHLKWRGWSDYYMSLSIYFPLAYKMLRRIISYIGNACMRIFASSIFTNGSIYNRMSWICQLIDLVTRSSLLVFESIHKSLFFILCCNLAKQSLVLSLSPPLWFVEFFKNLTSISFRLNSSFNRLFSLSIFPCQ